MGKPALNPAEILARRQAKRDTYLNLPYQLKCLKTLHNELYSLNNNQPNLTSAQEIQKAHNMRKLKAALWTQYRDNLPLPPPDSCTVLLLFDEEKKPFFEFRHQPDSWPEGWPTSVNDNADGEVALYSMAIYQKVMEGFEKETTAAQIRKDVRVVNRPGEKAASNAEVMSSQINVKEEIEEHEVIKIGLNENGCSTEQKKNTPEEGEVVESINDFLRKRQSDHNLDLSHLPPPSSNPKRLRSLDVSSDSVGGVGRNNSSSNNNQTCVPSFSSSSSSTCSSLTTASATSNLSSQNMTATVDCFLASPAFYNASSTDFLNCPVCSMLFKKLGLKDHCLNKHLRPYHCTFSDCAYTTGHYNSVYSHILKDHQTNDPGRYILYVE